MHKFPLVEHLAVAGQPLHWNQTVGEERRGEGDAVNVILANG